MLIINQSLLYKASSIAVLIALILFILDITDTDDRIWEIIHEQTTDESIKERSVWLPNYSANITGLAIPGIQKNASGITYNHDKQTLWIVVNNPTYLIELDLQLNKVRRVDMYNFKDTEAISYVGDDYYLITDERDQAITLAKIEDETKLLNKDDLQQVVLNIHGYSNKGLEGIAVDSHTNTIYAVRERDPMILVKVTGFIENENRINIENVEEIDVDGLYLDDFSGLDFDHNSGHLLFLSDESKLLVEVDLQGNKISYLDLEKGFNNLDQSIPQAEGVVLDDRGNLYIVSEPNLLYRFEKNKD
ncbi:MAG: SdiA-regulated domain-containing protein [Pseudomonadota bacterium]